MAWKRSPASNESVAAQALDWALRRLLGKVINLLKVNEKNQILSSLTRRLLAPESVAAELHLYRVRL
jgi:hypothetical protein